MYIYSFLYLYRIVSSSKYVLNFFQSRLRLGFFRLHFGAKFGIKPKRTKQDNSHFLNKAIYNIFKATLANLLSEP